MSDHRCASRSKRPAHTNTPTPTEKRKPASLRRALAAVAPPRNAVNRIAPRIEVLVHVYRPLLRRHSSEKGMRMRRAAARTGRDKSVDQADQPRLFRFDIALLIYHELLHRL